MIVALVQNMRALEIAHQTHHHQNIIVAETHDDKLLNIDSVIICLINY